MRTETRRITILNLSILFLFPCKANKDVSGYYSSNFPVIGFFGTAIQLNSDSTFEYRFAGDLMSDKADGIYKLNSDTISLTFNPEQPDEFIMSLPDSVRQTFKALEVPNYAAANRPYKLLYRNEKLLEINEEGEVVRRKEGESRNRRWLLWGDYYMKKRKYFLEKRLGKTKEK